MQLLGNVLRLYNRQARIFFLIVVGMGFAIDGVYSVLLNLYLLRLDYGTEFIGLVNAAGLLAFAVTSFPAGLVGSRISNTLMMKIGAGIVMVGGVMLPLAEFAPTGLQDAWLVGFYATLFVGFSFFFVNGAPFLMNIVERGRQNDAFAAQTALLSFSAFIGSLVGGIVPELLVRTQSLTLDDPAPYRSALMIVSVVLMVAFVLVWAIRPMPDDPDPDDIITDRRKAKSIGWTRPLVIMIVVMSLVRLFQVAGSATIVVYFNVYMDTQLNISTGVIGSIAAVGRLTGIPTALLVPNLVRRWGNVNVVIWSAIATAVCILPLALVANWIAAAIGFIGVMAMNSIRFTAFIVFILELVPKRQQAVMSGSGEMAGGFSFSMMALGGGIILSLFTFRDLFLLGAGFTVLGTIIFWAYARNAQTPRKAKPVI